MSTNPSRVWLKREIETFSASLPKGSRVLDAGAGNQIYKPIFADHLYETADFEKVDKEYVKSTYVCDLGDIPVPDAYFDAVLFSQVMEHLPNPGAVLKEFNRILKPGARLFYSAPLLYEEHEKPYDFFRYTQFGVRFLFEGAGFKVERLFWLEGYMGSLNYLFKRMLRHWPRSPRALGGGLAAWILVFLLMTLRPILKVLVYLTAWCDIRHRYQDTGFPLNYGAIVIKE